MKNPNIGKGIAVIVAVIVIVGAYYFPKYKQSAPLQVAGTSPSGSTFLNAKFAGIAMNLASPGTNGTSSSILNTDANDRYVHDFKVGCEGVGTSKTAYTGTGLANLQIAIGTTTTAAPATFLSFAAITTGANISTSTVNFEVASSTTLVATSSLAAIWPANTYMTFFWNATNTAACTVGVGYFGS